MKDFRSEIEYWYGSTSELARQLRRQQPRDYNDFIDCLYSDLEELFGLLEADAKDLMSMGEDFLNREIVRMLRFKTYQASHDHDEGGHVDVHVRSSDGRFTWLAEAKIDNGPSKLFEGMSQLTERYARGTHGHNCGALLIYVQKDKIIERIANWRTNFEASGKYDVRRMADCDVRPGLAFYSDIVLPRIGDGSLQYRIRHIGVSLYRRASSA